MQKKKKKKMMGRLSVLHATFWVCSNHGNRLGLEGRQKELRIQPVRVAQTIFTWELICER